MGILDKFFKREDKADFDRYSKEIQSSKDTKYKRELYSQREKLLKERARDKAKKFYQRDKNIYQRVDEKLAKLNKGYKNLISKQRTFTGKKPFSKKNNLRKSGNSSRSIPINRSSSDNIHEQRLRDFQLQLDAIHKTRTQSQVAPDFVQRRNQAIQRDISRRQEFARQTDLMNAQLVVDKQSGSDMLKPKLFREELNSLSLFTPFGSSDVSLNSNDFSERMRRVRGWL